MAKTDEREEFIKKHPRVTAREMPASYEAECALIGGVIIDGDTAIKYLPQLSADDFYTPSHKLLIEAIKALFADAQAIDLVTVVQKMTALGTLEISGGVEYITNLVKAVPSVANSEYYFGILKKMTKLRAMIRVARQMADEAYALDPDDGALTRAESTLYALAESGSTKKPELVTGYIDEALKDLQQRETNRDAYRGVPTGFTYLDTMLGGGFQKSDLIILAARPGQGKTSFAMNCAVNAALSKRPDNKKPYTVLVFSLEMSAVQLARRMLCSVGGYSMSQTNRADIGQIGWAKLYGAQAKFAGTNLYIDETGDITPAQIVSKCRQLKHSVGLDFVMIDYLQLMHSGKHFDSVVHEIGAITRALKLAAKELNVPILLLSQMSRSIEQRKDPTPQLSDLRDSGAIEQDADIVMFLDRTTKPADGNSDDGDAPSGGNIVYLNVAKHRNGETGAVKLAWMPATVTFKNIDRPPAPPASEPNRGSASGFMMDDDVPLPDDGEEIF
ncbi:MAG: replicative DNA helicase [Clostridiales bacterium]|nr:replicative DNA helicase [Clostridiales bacterium]